MDGRLTSRPSEIRLSTRFFTAEIMRHADYTFVVAQLSPSLFLATSDYTKRMQRHFKTDSACHVVKQ